MALPNDAAARKAAPMARGLLDYFPDALAAVAHLSLVANEQHNPGEPLHWSKDKSSDHADCLIRHAIDRGKIDADGERHSTKLAWRALANLQIELEAAAAKPTIEEVADRAPPACPDTDDLWCNPVDVAEFEAAHRDPVVNHAQSYLGPIIDRELELLQRRGLTRPSENPTL